MSTGGTRFWTAIAAAMVATAAQCAAQAPVSPLPMPVHDAPLTGGRATEPQSGRFIDVLSPCPRHNASACRSDGACFWVEIHGTLPGAPTAGFCTRRFSDAEFARLSPPRLPETANDRMRDDATRVREP